MTHSQIPDDLRRNAMTLAAELEHQAGLVYTRYMDEFRKEWHDLLGFHFVGGDHWQDAFRDAIQAGIPTAELLRMFVKAMKLTVPNSTA